MSAQPKIIRGRMIKQHDILVDSNKEGGLHVLVGEVPADRQQLDLSESQALLLYELLPAMFAWDSPEPEERP